MRRAVYLPAGEPLSTIGLREKRARESTRALSGEQGFAFREEQEKGGC